MKWLTVNTCIVDVQHCYVYQLLRGVWSWNLNMQLLHVFWRFVIHHWAESIGRRCHWNNVQTKREYFSQVDIIIIIDQPHSYVGVDHSEIQQKFFVINAATVNEKYRCQDKMVSVKSIEGLISVLASAYETNMTHLLRVLRPTRGSWDQQPTTMTTSVSMSQFSEGKL